MGGRRTNIYAGIAVALVIAVPVGFCLAGQVATATFGMPADRLDIQSGAMWAPIPECDDAEVTLDVGGSAVTGRLAETAYIRDQRIGRFVFDVPVIGDGEISVQMRFVEPRTDRCVKAGPFTGVLQRNLTGYGAPVEPDSFSGPGRVTRCVNLSDCMGARADLLMICGHSLFSSTYIDSLAAIWAARMGLNVAAIDAADVSTTSPVTIRDFIESLYDSRSAEHYGDGRLGFVVLVGDAYEDDNSTRMVPDYDGYGGTSSASDHFYACVSGSDDFEDVMLGRIPVGNPTQLVAYYSKLRDYSPLPLDQWTKSVLLIAGCFFAYKDDYVDLFDEYESYVPSGYSVSRFYRQDYPINTAGDVTACQAVTDSLNHGFAMALYSGDGDNWDWGGSTKRAFRSSYIPNLVNKANLPVMLCIACSNGWFDNTTVTYGDGGVDCFAERLLVAPAGGAIACVASPRETGGGASTVFAHEILRAAFVNGSTFVGEMMLEAKTRHLLDLGGVVFVRQFNLFGDPCLNFALTEMPVTAPDVTVRPYHVKIEPEFANPGQPLVISAEVWNASGVYLDAVDVGLFDGPPDSGAALIDSRALTEFCPWEKRAVQFAVDGLSPGPIEFCVAADAGNLIWESDEVNNSVTASTYVYPSQLGFPVRVGDDIRSQVVADLNSDGASEILVTSCGSTAEAVDMAGHAFWQRSDLGLTQWFDGVEPAVGDLNGDGTTECVIPIKSGFVVADGATGANKWTTYTDYPCLSPLIVDLNGDGVFEIVLGTYSFAYSKVWAFDAAGARKWTHDIPGSAEKLTGIVACDPEMDGTKDLVLSTNLGRLRRLSCETEPPTIDWDVSLSSNSISSIVGGDLDKDGSIEIVANHDTTISIIDVADGSVKDAFGVGATQCNWFLSLADVDGDGALEILCGSSCGEIGIIDDGTMTLHLYYEGIPFRAPVAADVDGDGSHEIVFTLSDGQMRIVNLDGSDQIAPVPLRSSCAITPIADDLDDDPNLEIVAGSIDSVLFVFDLDGGGGPVEWPCAAGSPYRTNLYAQPLYGALTGDLTLNGRIDVVGDVNVPAGATLTLERGTELRFRDDAVSPIGSAAGRCEMIVQGGMIARGTACGRVRIMPAHYPPAKDDWQGILLKPGSTGSFTQTDIVGAVTAIDCQTSEAVVSETRITSSSVAVKVTGASPLIDSNEFASNDYGIMAGLGGPTIVHNLIKTNRYGGITLSGGSTALLEANLVSGTVMGNGLAIYSSSPTLGRDNRFEFNSASGVYMSGSSPAIDSCWIFNNGDCGLKVAYYSNPVISKTSIVGNTYGVGAFINARPVLGDTAAGLGGQNDIRDNTSYAILNRTGYQIKAEANWWGTSDPGPSLFYGSVDFSDWLIQPPAGVNDPVGRTAMIEAVLPNPFVSSVELRLNLSAFDLPVTVNVFDVRGRLVRKISPVAQAGIATVKWDGLDTFGNEAASGAYFVSVVSPKRSETRKIVLAR